MKEAILLGVPMLVYPRRADQPGNAARVVFHGLGRRGEYRREGWQAIRGKVLALLSDDDVRGRVAAMRGHFLRYEIQNQDIAAFEGLLS